METKFSWFYRVLCKQTTGSLLLLIFINCLLSTSSVLGICVVWKYRRKDCMAPALGSLVWVVLFSLHNNYLEVSSSPPPFLYIQIRKLRLRQVKYLVYQCTAHCFLSSYSA